MRVYCAIMRGGTSKGVFFHEKDLPADPALRDQVVLRIFGSPDKRQIDGLGGADLLTSKAVIIRPSSRPDADVDYLFGQVSVTEPEVDWSGLCGNLSAAVGPFAVDEGLIPAPEPVTSVRIYCPAFDRRIIAEVPVRDGATEYEGDFEISGVPGAASRIGLDYSDLGGGATGALLPTGNVRDVLDVPGLGQVECSIVDCGNPMVFVRPEAVGLRGDEWPTTIDADTSAVAKIEAIRRAAAARVGKETEWDWGRLKSPLLPILGIVQPPRSYVNFVTSQPNDPDELDLFCICYTAGFTHKTYAGTTTVCTGPAAKISGTLVHECLSARGREREEVIIGHPSGWLPIEVAVRRVGDFYEVEKAKVYRTARRIMEGYARVPDSLLAPVAEAVGRR